MQCCYFELIDKQKQNSSGFYEGFLKLGSCKLEMRAALTGVLVAV